MKSFFQKLEKAFNRSSSIVGFCIVISIGLALFPLAIAFFWLLDKGGIYSGVGLLAIIVGTAIYGLWKYWPRDNFT